MLTTDKINRRMGYQRLAEASAEATLASRILSRIAAASRRAARLASPFGCSVPNCNLNHRTGRYRS